jgi:hypothetical protein
MTEELGLMDDDKKLISFHDQLAIPCHIYDEGCIIHEKGTYIWKEPGPEETCPFFASRVVKGTEVIDGKGNRIFISNDGAMVRLQKKGPVTQCGSVLYATDYTNLYLTTDFKHKQFKRPLPSRYVSVVTYANQQDGFVFKHMLSTIKREVNAVREEQCRKETTQRGGNYARKAAEQHAVGDGQTAHLGKGTFVTSAGEIWYQYQCRPLRVKIRGTIDCYDALPVKLVGPDLKKFVEQRRARNLTVDSRPTFFLEPRTHRLTTVASPRPCAPPFTPVYKNAHGHWIATTGSHFYRTPEPLLVDGSDWMDTARQEAINREFNFEEGGIYTDETIKKMEQFMQAPRIQEGILSKMAQTADFNFAPGRTIYGSNYFPDIPSVETTYFLDVMGWLWKAMEKYLSLCTILVGTAILLRMFTWICGVVIRLYSPRQPGTGFLFHFITAFFPSLRDYARDRAAGRGGGGIGVLRILCDCVGGPRYRAYRPPGGADGQDAENDEDSAVHIAEATAQRAAFLVHSRLKKEDISNPLPDFPTPRMSKQLNKDKTIPSYSANAPVDSVPLGTDTASTVTVRLGSSDQAAGGARLYPEAETSL